MIVYVESKLFQVRQRQMLLTFDKIFYKQESRQDLCYMLQFTAPT